MALTDNGTGNGMIMPVSPMYAGGYGGGFGGNFGGDWGWIILLLLAFNGGWGGFGGFGGGMGGFAADGAMLYPWMNQAEITTDGFRDQMLNTNITSIRDGVSNLSTQLCNCCADMQMSLANGFAGVEQGANARQIANMQQAFAAQTATTQGFNNVQSQLASGFCDNRAGLADVKYTIATEECATRNADTQNTQALLTAFNNGIQSIKDELCADRLDAERRENANLRSELMFARGQASQNEQTAIFQQGLNNEIDAMYNRLSNCPIPSIPVYGRQNIFTCNNNGCGCGCNGGNF